MKRRLKIKYTKTIFNGFRLTIFIFFSIISIIYLYNNGNKESRLLKKSSSVQSRLVETINEKRSLNALKPLNTNGYLDETAKRINDDKSLAENDSKLLNLLNLSSNKYTYAKSYVVSNMFILYGDQETIDRILKYLETNTPNEGIYNPANQEVGVYISTANESYISTSIVWAQLHTTISVKNVAENQKLTVKSTPISNFNTKTTEPNLNPGVATNSPSSSTTPKTSSTVSLPEVKITFDPLSDIYDYRPPPTFDISEYLPSSGSCSSVTSRAPNKYYYKCKSGQKPSGIACQAIAPYDNTSKLWSCLK